jgi:hypothetical protein
MKDAKDILQWRCCIYANATILEAILSSVKTVLLVETMGYQNHSGRFACHKHHNNRSKIKRTKIAWSLKLLDLIGPLGRKRQFD